MLSTTCVLCENLRLTESLWFDVSFSVIMRKVARTLLVTELMSRAN